MTGEVWQLTTAGWHWWLSTVHGHRQYCILVWISQWPKYNWHQSLALRFILQFHCLINLDHDLSYHLHITQVDETVKLKDEIESKALKWQWTNYIKWLYKDMDTLTSIFGKCLLGSWSKLMRQWNWRMKWRARLWGWLCLGNWLIHTRMQHNGVQYYLNPCTADNH
jgi:hypothetical protein